ncbi:MAG: radical SAM protein [archaeon]
MESYGQHIHWFVTSRCNDNCIYCFKPDTQTSEDREQLVKLAGILAESGVKKVTIGGGDPSLVKDLDSALKILHQGRTKISYHTNGLLLTSKKIETLARFVDDIALPIDSTTLGIQETLRSRQFVSTYEQLPELAKAIKDNGMQLGWHTVFTALNSKEMPKLFKKLEKTDFDYWRIYEFNYDLARMRVLKQADKAKNKKQKLELFERYKKVIAISPTGNPEKGYSDCLYAYFLLAEEKMLEKEDSRIQFVGIRDPPFHNHPYTFLENNGDVSFYSWFSESKRELVGNILTEPYDSILQKLELIADHPWDEHDIAAGLLDKPVWARVEEGSYAIEEVEDISPRYLSQVEKLARLYLERESSLNLVEC